MGSGLEPNCATTAVLDADSAPIVASCPGASPVRQPQQPLRRQELCLRQFGATNGKEALPKSFQLDVSRSVNVRWRLRVHASMINTEARRPSCKDPTVYKSSCGSHEPIKCQGATIILCMVSSFLHARDHEWG